MQLHPWVTAEDNSDFTLGPRDGRPSCDARRAPSSEPC